VPVASPRWGPRPAFDHTRRGESTRWRKGEIADSRAVFSRSRDGKWPHLSEPSEGGPSAVRASHRRCGWITARFYVRVAKAGLGTVWDCRALHCVRTGCSSATGMACRPR